MKYLPQIIELVDGTKCVRLEDFRRECDEAREAIRALAEHGESEIQRITKERDEALDESLEQARLLGISGEWGCRLIAERDEAKKKYDIEATEHMLNINEICNQRDAAMDVLEEISFYLSSGLGDENTTVQEYKDRIIDGIKHLAGHAWEERCKYEKLWKEAEDALMKIEDIYIDGDDTYEDWKSMGQIARTFLENKI
jgi:hypothetical protein